MLGGEAKLAQRLRLNLADALAREGEALAHLFERVIARLVDTKSHAEDLLLPRRKRLEELARLVVEAHLGVGLVRRKRGVVGDELAHVRLAVVTNRRLEADRLARDLHDGADLLHGNARRFGELLGGRLTPI